MKRYIKLAAPLVLSFGSVPDRFPPGHRSVLIDFESLQELWEKMRDKGYTQSAYVKAVRLIREQEDKK